MHIGLQKETRRCEIIVMAKAVWAFDFDGVVCDSVHESALAAWKVSFTSWNLTNNNINTEWYHKVLNDFQSLFDERLCYSLSWGMNCTWCMKPPSPIFILTASKSPCRYTARDILISFYALHILQQCFTSSFPAKSGHKWDCWHDWRKITLWARF